MSELLPADNQLPDLVNFLYNLLAVISHSYMNIKKLKPGMLLSIKSDKKNKYFLISDRGGPVNNSRRIRPLTLMSTKHTIFKSDCGDKWLDNELFLYLGKSNINIDIPVIGEVLASYHQVLWDGEVYEIISHNFFSNMKIV